MSIRTFFTESLADHPERVAFTYRAGKEIVTKTYREVGERVKAIAEITRTLGIVPRNNPVAIILENGANWIEVYLAHVSVGIPVVPVDPKLKPEEVAYMMGDAKVCAIYTDAKHVSMLASISKDLPELKSVVVVEGKVPEVNDISFVVYDLEAELAKICKVCVFDEGFANDDDVASIIYTSGTTGRPKGALITHGNFCADVDGALKLFPKFDYHEDFFVILPLFHAFSFAANFLAPLRIAAGMQFTTSLRTIGDDMRAFRPTVLLGVPLLIEKMYAKVEDKIKHSKLAQFLLKVGLRSLVVHSIRGAFGGRIRLIIVGGAPCSAKMLEAMRRLKMPIIEGYGLTEASPIVSVSQMDNFKIGTIGIPLPNIEVKIDEPNEQGIGELLVRGPIVMRGYLNKPEATRETIDEDGYLHTGDLASQDSDGFITIRGRKKSLIVNREGKNIYPEEVEICIGNDRRILDVLVQGYHDGDDIGEKVGVIVVPNNDAFKNPDGSLMPWEEIEKSLHKVVAERCEHLAEYKHPRKVKVYKEPLERTSSQKIRRYKYRDVLNG